MRNIELKRLPADRGAVADPGVDTSGAPPLVSVLWGRRWAFALTVLACLLAAGCYLLFATRVYRATATVFVQQNAPRAFSDSAGYAAPSDTFLQSQADVIQSTPVLSRVVGDAQYRSLRTFADVTGDPVTWLRKGNRLSVDVVKRSDVIGVSVESPYPSEAAVLADAVVKAYIVEQSQRAREVGREMVRVLQKERDQIRQKRDAAVQEMLKAQKEGGIPTFRDGKGNLILNRLDALSTALSATEVEIVDLRARQDTILDALESPKAMRTYVEGLQFKGRDVGDREYDDLRNQLSQYTAQLAALAGIQGPNHPRSRTIQSMIDSVKTQIADKEKSIADSQLADVTARLAAAEQKEGDLRKALESQRNKALDLSPGAATYARLESEAQELGRRGELLDTRIAELTVNAVDAGPFNVRVLQPALVPEKPVKPNKALTLAAALLVGCVLGIGFATLREYQDARFRSPEEIPSLLGVPLVGVVPRISRRLSPVDRGQVLRLDSRSPVAEAYRSIRTSLDLGDARSAKTILVASPTPGDGKSTTAGNLAIAFAQAGDRTLLLDCDLREPVQHLIFETEGAAGMSTVMPGETKLRDSILRTRVQNLYLLPCGPVPRTPAEMLASDRFKHLLRILCEAFDRIVIDSPSLEEVTDGRILAAAADVTVLVLRIDQTMRRSGALAVMGLEEVGANVLGAIANDVPSVAAYRLDVGAWQYAAAARNQVEGAGTNGTALHAPGTNGAASSGAGSKAGGALPPRTGELKPISTTTAHFSGETITISEPDWPAEQP